MQFKPATLEESKKDYARYYDECPGGFDDYVETHFREGRHYSVVVEGQHAGTC